MVYWVRLKTVELKEVIIDVDVANKMKSFLHTAWRNAQLLLWETTRFRSGHGKSITCNTAI